MVYTKFIVLFELLLTIRIECKLQCDYTAYDDAGAWLKYHEEPADWNTARRQCAFEGAVLASPIGTFSTARFKSIVLENAPYAVFTGIRKSHFTGNFISVEDTSLATIPHKWAVSKGEPNNVNGKKECVIFNHNAEMEDVDCNQNYPYICYNSYESIQRECGIGYKLSPISNSCHKFHHELLTHDQAEEVCVREGGHLLVINSFYEKFAVLSLIKRASNSTYYIRVGFRKLNGKWVTVHGQTLDEAGYSTFAPGEPNDEGGIEDCGSIQRDGEGMSIYKIVLYNDVPCNITTYNFICEKDLQCVHEDSNIIVF